MSEDEKGFPYRMPWEDVTADSFLWLYSQIWPAAKASLWVASTVLYVALMFWSCEHSKTAGFERNCNARHERWLLQLDAPMREHAYEGRNDCAKAGLADKAAHFSEYLERTKK